MTEYADVPAGVLAELRRICAALPDAYEQQAWTGLRWMVRKKTIVHVLTLDEAAGPRTIIVFRAAGEELDVLHHSGHPFFRPGWGSDVVGMVLDGATDWTEVEELVTDSYCVMAPKKLAALIDRPEP